jgi:SAM-dependent methyltransferase
VKRLNLGAGADTRAGWVNVDRVFLPGIDVVHDLDMDPWPWEDASVDEISAIDVFEHVEDPLVFMNQAGRILKPGGILRIRTAYWRHENSYSDPTHKRHCTEKSFDYWIAGTEFYEKYHAAYAAPGVAFSQVSNSLEGSELVVVLRRL